MMMEIEEGETSGAYLDGRRVREQNNFTLKPRAD